VAPRAYTILLNYFFGYLKWRERGKEKRKERKNEKRLLPLIRLLSFRTQCRTRTGHLQGKRRKKGEKKKNPNIFLPFAVRLCVLARLNGQKRGEKGGEKREGGGKAPLRLLAEILSTFTPDGGGKGKEEEKDPILGSRRTYSDA